ncbi:MAG: hypothetical protein IJT49_01015 [Clostridia bacterium]|nr:hypothetical protein [Clostridia bacterium]
MKTKKAAIIIFAVVLSVALAYTVAATVTLASEYEGEGVFAAASDAAARLFTDPFMLTFKKTAYKLFGAVMEEGITAGRDGYLFPTKTADFDYAADISGQAHYDEETKSKFLYYLFERRDALALDNCELYVFVIPNSQTVLRDKLKTKDKNGVTAAEDLEAYLHKYGFDNFYLLEDALKDAEFDVYNNTENIINGYGAYLICRDIAKRLPDAVSRRSGLPELDNGEIAVSYSDGGALAKEAGLEKLIKNKNVFYPYNKFTSRYTSEISGNLTVCGLKDEYNCFIGRSALLLQIPDGERTLFMPLFSSSYTDTVYNNSLSYSHAAMSAVKPTVNVCIVREDRLVSLLNDADISTYEARIENAGGGKVTAAPVITAVSYKQSGSAFVAGTCEDGVSVTVASGAASVTVAGKNGLFIAEIKANKNEELTVFAESGADGKSDSVKCTVPSASSSEESVFAGGSSNLYYGETVKDYTGANLYKPEQLVRITRRFESTLSKIREASGKDTEIIFLSAPDPLSVYPESASEEHKSKKAETTRLDQFRDAASGVDGVKFLDIREVMRQNTDIDKLYYQTDTHWTEIGAYFGYRAIAEASGQTPYSLNLFKAEEKTVPGGDLSSFAGLYGVTENVKFLNPAFKLKAVGIADKPETIDRSVYAGELESAVNDDSLPKAIMIRDSYSANLFPFICDHYGYMYCQRMWDYNVNYDKIAEIKPDYVIYVICERNLDMW